MKSRFIPQIFNHHIGKLMNLKSVAIMLLAIFLFSNNVKAQVTLKVTSACTSNGNTEITSIPTGSPFIFVIDYSISSLTDKGNNVVISLPLPTNLGLNGSLATAVAYDKSQVASVTN